MHHTWSDSCDFYSTEDDILVDSFEKNQGVYSRRFLYHGVGDAGTKKQQGDNDVDGKLELWTRSFS